jgi:hypothetical protein
MSKFVTMKRSNLKAALRLAIEKQTEFERDHLGYTTYSALLIGWRQVYMALCQGESVRIEEE